MSIHVEVLKQEHVGSTETFRQVQVIAAQLHAYLDGDHAQQLILERHILGASSARIQEIFLDEATRLGFESERKRLFSDYAVSALRPDYFCRVDDTGILLEVERGKTTINNNDLLDLWKCHICHYARYLFLIVPKIRTDERGKITQEFSHVQKRLATFFEPGNYVNVDAVFLFGY